MSRQETEPGGMRVCGKPSHVASSRTAWDSQKDVVSKTKGKTIKGGAQGGLMGERGRRGNEWVLLYEVT